MKIYVCEWLEPTQNRWVKSGGFITRRDALRRLDDLEHAFQQDGITTEIRVTTLEH